MIVSHQDIMFHQTRWFLIRTPIITTKTKKNQSLAEHSNHSQGADQQNFDAIDEDEISGEHDIFLTECSRKKKRSVYQEPGGRKKKKHHQDKARLTRIFVHQHKHAWFRRTAQMLVIRKIKRPKQINVVNGILYAFGLS